MHKKHSLPTCAGIALALLLLTNASAHADIIWSYNWTPSTTQIVANAGGSGYLSLTNEPSHSATGSSNTVITNIQAVSTAPSSNPATFNQVPISFTLQLQDAASNATSTATFSGYFSGTITGSSSNVQLTFTSPMTETLTLGGNQYSAVVGTYTPPGPPGGVNSGSLNAFVTVTPSNGGGGIASVPEPAALTLACLALPIVGLTGWRKRRAKA
ncbi:MAG TPA: hypothetical protein VMF69_22790 [Gemmataceae bacterium]|nr:hypothetical protein [Gemmataceae bacterium]